MTLLLKSLNFITTFLSSLPRALKSCKNCTFLFESTSSVYCRGFMGRVSFVSYGYRDSFPVPRGKTVWAWGLQLPSSAEVKESAGLCLYSPSGLLVVF